MLIWGDKNINQALWCQSWIISTSRKTSLSISFANQSTSIFHSLLFSHENNLLFLSAINKGPSVIKICKTLEQQATHTCYAWENLIINLPYISFESFSIFIKNNTTLHVSHTSFYALIKIRQWVAKCENKTPSCFHNKDLISAQNAFNHSTNAPMWTKFIHVYLVFQIIKNKNQYIVWMLPLN